MRISLVSGIYFDLNSLYLIFLNIPLDILKQKSSRNNHVKFMDSRILKTEPSEIDVKGIESISKRKVAKIIQKMMKTYARITFKDRNKI